MPGLQRVELPWRMDLTGKVIYLIHAVGKRMEWEVTKLPQERTSVVFVPSLGLN